MRIMSMQNYYVNNKQLCQNGKEHIFLPERESGNCVTNPTSSNILFKGLSPKYLKAKKYLEREISCGFDKEEGILYDLNLNKLDGIQEGIKVFEGLNMKEIAFLTNTLSILGVNRGCHNLCSHCFVNAKPPIEVTENRINKMSWDDFKSLNDGIKELNTRLGFNAFNGTTRTYLSPFHDADAMYLSLTDGKGVEHDFVDISNTLHEVSGLPILFDTAGWTPSHKKLQQRAEEFAKYYSKPENYNKLYQFNVSINPFHVLHAREVKLLNEGNSEKADKFRDLYTTRMANTIFTLTPIMRKGKLHTIMRAGNNNDEVMKGFQANDLLELVREIHKKLEVMYKADYNGEQKIIKDKKQIFDNLRAFSRETRNVGAVVVTERGAENFGTDISNYDYTKENIKKIRDFVTDTSDAQNYRYSRMVGILDSNGDYYLTDYVSTYPVELKLNFENSLKETAPIYPYLQKDLPIKKSVINNVVDDSPVLL